MAIIFKMLSCRLFCAAPTEQTHLKLPSLVGYGSRYISTCQPGPRSYKDHYFNYTYGRWLYNEQKRLDERRLHFNIPALLEIAAKSVHRQKSDVELFLKMHEGGFNRVFLIGMRDGLEVIARLPYPSTQPKVLATASEVATMDLVRRYGVPTPRVLAYSTNARNPVGSEYIVMEKVSDSDSLLSEIWYDITDEERVKVLGEIVDQEAKMFSITLPAYGSIFNSADLPEQMGRIRLASEEEFCVGPDVSLKYWFERQSQLDIPRGPAMTPQDVLDNAANKEIAWLRTYGRPRLPFNREYREMFNYEQVDPSEHIRNLQNFLAIAPHLVPSESWLHRPVLRHPDLTPNNIFVDDDLNITSFIDWKHAVVLPLFLHAGIPVFFQDYGDPNSLELNEPENPANFDVEHDLDFVDEEDRENDLDLYRLRHTHFSYVEATANKLGIHYDAMAHDKGLRRKKIYQHAAEPWKGNSVPLQADLVQLARDWSKFTNGHTSCPITFDAQEAQKTMNKMLEQELIDWRMIILREDMIGVGRDGWVSPGRYREAAMKAAEMKEQALGSAESEYEREMTEKHWPFDDFDEDE